MTDPGDGRRAERGGQRKQQRRVDERGFRALLVLGAIISIAIGIWGLAWTGMLESVLGFDVPKRSLGLARVFGGVMIAVGIGYALAAAQPQRSRSLLVPLFVVPAITAVSVIAGTARGEIDGARGVVFVVYNLAYCFLYFRMYPRVTVPETASPRAPEPPSPGTTPR